MTENEIDYLCAIAARYHEEAPTGYCPRCFRETTRSLGDDERTPVTIGTVCRGIAKNLCFHCNKPFNNFDVKHPSWFVGQYVPKTAENGY